VIDTDARVNLLVAYPYWNAPFNAWIKQHSADVRLLIDSGAFTAWRGGKVIELDDYCRFLEALPVHPWRYFALDVVGDPAATMRNFEAMIRRGFKPVPIFTRGEDVSVLEDYYKHSDVVGIGGLVGTPKKKPFVNGVMKRIGKRRVHFLGFTGEDYLKFYRPYMCDSNSWDYGDQYGHTYVYMGNGKLASLDKRDLKDAPMPAAVMDRIRYFGFDPYAFRHQAAWRGKLTGTPWPINRKLCARSAVEFSLDLQQHLGTLMFNAIATVRSAYEFIEAFQHYKRAHA
jgi:hypothetical protein